MRRFSILTFILLTCLFSYKTNAQIITTVIGGGTANGQSATNISISIDEIAMDTAGNFYLTSAGCNRVWKVSASGIVSLLAGTGIRGASGDGGPATAASLNYPYGIAVDRVGNVFVADMNNHRIRKINTSGIISTLAGNGVPAFSGDGGPATASQLNLPTCLATDTLGNLYVTDRNNSHVRKIDVGGTIHSIAGGGSSYSASIPATAARINDAFGIWVDKNMDVYIACAGWDAIQKITVSTGMLKTIAGGIAGFAGDGGPATASRLRSPRDVAVDDSGNVYFDDYYNIRIRKINTSGIISTMAGNGTVAFSGDGGPATAAKTSGCTGVWSTKNGTLYITDGGRIRQINASRVISSYMDAGIYDGVSATDAQLSGVAGISVDGSGNLYVNEWANNRVRKVAAGSRIITTIAGSGLCSNLFDGSYSGDGGPATAATLNRPRKTIVDRAGNLYIADTRNHRIRKVDTAGVITTFAGIGTGGFNGDTIAATSAMINYPSSLAVDTIGNIYIGDALNCRVRKVDTAGIITTVAGNGTCGYITDSVPATSTKIDQPEAICFDTSWNLLIGSDRRIRRVDAAGIISTIAGLFSSSAPTDGVPAATSTIEGLLAMTCDRRNNVYINSGSSNIRKIDGAGIITRYAGNDTECYNGDNRPALTASMYNILGLAVDGHCNLYVADLSNSRVRMIAYNHDPELAAGHSLAVTVCSPRVLDSFLAVIDSETIQTITWTTIVNPLHGTMSSSYSHISTGGVTNPSGFTYTPTAGYTGTDAATVVVSDGYAYDTVSFTFNIASIPVLSTIGGPDTLCIGNGVILTNTYPGGTWSSTGTAATVSSTGFLTGLSAGVARISYSASNICGVDIATQNITVMPDLAAITGPDAVCIGATILLAHTLAGGTWVSSGAFTYISSAGNVTGLSLGSETVYYIVYQGCWDTVSKIITIKDCNASVSNVTAASVAEISVSPNPNTGSLGLSIAGFPGNEIPFSVTDLFGRKVYSGTVKANEKSQVQLDCPHGVYFIETEVSGRRFFAKLVIAE